MTALTDMVDLEKRGGVTLITVNNPPVNALSHGVRDGLKKGLKAFAEDPEAKALVIACAGRTFIAGADISEFGKPPKEPGLHEVLDLIEGSPKPVVAAIHGTALGGGLEVALACHYRVGAPGAQFGLPEVKLGLLPGAGGTQRLPRVVGVEKALDMIAGGDPIGVAEAKATGLVDAVANDDLVEGAIAYAAMVVVMGWPLVKIGENDTKVAEPRGKPEIFAEFRKKIARTTKGFEAPEKCIQCVEASVNMPFREGLAFERKSFEELMAGTQSKAQRFYFFAEREAAKVPDVPKDTPTRPVKKVGVLGAGTMGGGITMNFASAGIPVTLIEMKQDALDRGIGIIRKNYENTAKRAGWPEGEVDRLMSLISGSVSYDDLADVDLVIEAVFENMDIKKEVFAKLDAICKPGAILATNTSTLDINQIASATKRPEDVVGMHFFSPANVMKLLENVRGEKTAKDVIATVMQIGKTINKVPVLAGVCDGFIGNRMLAKRGYQTEKLILEGARPMQVDKVITDFGFRMGPFAMNDLTGLDVGWRIRQERGVSSPVPDTLVDRGRLGQKTGAGYYKYEEGNRAPIEDPEVLKLIEEVAEQHQVRRREIDDQEVLERCLYPMINEGAKILEEGIAIRASDIDVTWVNGYGWPRYWAGPMFYADQIGLEKIVERLRHYRELTGDPFWEPAPLLVKLAEEGKGFLDAA